MTVQRLIGWAVLAVMLSILADIPQTTDIAVAFAWLILIAVLLGIGPTAFNNLTKLVGGKVAATEGG